jgi:hypothetical protein
MFDFDGVRGSISELARGLVYGLSPKRRGEPRIGLLIPRTRKIRPATSPMVEEFR